jgi:enoyl-CoA hydratase/carnithine racemase
MVAALLAAYTRWDADPRVSCIVLSGAGKVRRRGRKLVALSGRARPTPSSSSPSQAFCAGGDVKAVVAAVREGRAADADAFFRAEYTLDWAISRLATPHVALLHGVVFGGGAGLVMHGRYAVATEGAVFAMPECGIGLFPDVGASHALPRLPGALGAWIALTGARIHGPDLVRAGVASHYVPAAGLPALVAALSCARPPRRRAPGSPCPIKAALDAASVPLPPGELGSVRAAVDAVFGDWASSTLAEMRSRLAARAPGEPWAATALEAFDAECPQSRAVTLALLRAGARAPLGAALRLEFRAITTALAPGSVFCEGVTAKLVEKRAPAWRGGGGAAAVAVRLAPPAADRELELGDAARGARPRL